MLAPNPALAAVKVLNSTPGIIARYALGDEQALLAILRYNRLIDVFLGITCCSLQNHLRTTVSGLGQVETDEIYVGLDRMGAHYVVPVQAKGGRDRLSPIQIEQDIAMCGEKFPQATCRPVGAQFGESGRIVLLEFESTPEGIRIRHERHDVLVDCGDLADAELQRYRGLRQID